MKNLLLIVFLVFFGICQGQSNRKLLKEIKKYHTSKNVEFADPEKSILTPEDLKTFRALDFYPADLKFRVVAKFVRTPNEKPFLMPTTTDRLPEYVKYGEAHFTLDGKDLVLALYQNTEGYEDPAYENYLFLPFTDLTSGDGSYGGGRFLDVYIPESATIILDFNRAYNPYCAYNPRYSCPIPPKENDLLVRIEAGVKDYGHH